MTWLNAPALLGLLGVAVPVLVHLFGRRVARRQRFPSLRLLRIAAPSTSTARRPSDLLLLLVRSLMVALAAIALAQPLWPVNQSGPAGPAVARAVIVDTSASMQRLSTGGARAGERARTIGTTMLDSARHRLLIETSRPGANVAAAASWLASQPGMRELVVVSDFQRGAVSDGDLAQVPPPIGITLVRVETAPGTMVDTSLQGVRVQLTGGMTQASWERSSSDSSTFPLAVLHREEDDANVRAAVEAARRVMLPVRSGRTLAVVFPGFSPAPFMTAAAEPLTAAWQGELALALARHPMVSEIRAPALSSACQSTDAAPVPNAIGQRVAGVAAGVAPYDVLVSSCVDPGSTAAAALLAAVSSSLAPSIAWSELETDVLPDDILRQWMRQPTKPGPVGEDRTSPHSRWVWLPVLLLLGLEEWLRRHGRRDVAASFPPRRAHAA